MSSTITRHITDTDSLSADNGNNNHNLNLNWMDNTIGVNPDITGLEGNIGYANNERTATDTTANTSVPLDDMTQDTLDEPILATLVRDLAGIYTKLKLIIIPISLSSVGYRNVLKEWDLWGPLLLTVFLALSLHHNEETVGQTVLVGPHFAHVFVLIWVSNLVLSLNYKLLNSCRKRSAEKSANAYNPTTFQLLCVFGYCLSPPSLAVIALKVLSLVMGTEVKHLFYEKLIIGIIMGFLWPTFCSTRIIAKYISKDRRLLAIYPIGLFYFVLSWALITTH